MSFISTYSGASYRGWQNPTTGELGPFVFLNQNFPAPNDFNSIAINDFARLNNRKVAVGMITLRTARVYDIGSNTFANLTPNNNPSNTDINFGRSIDINADSTYVVVGAPIYPNVFATNTGTVYVYNYSNGSWTQQANIIPSGNTYASFGQDVAIDQYAERISITSFGDTYANANNLGALYVYSRSGNTWSLEQKLSDPYLVANLTTIRDMTMNGYGNIIVNSTRTTASNTANVYIWTRSNTTWTLTQTINSNVGYYFGDSLAISFSGNTLLISEGNANSNPNSVRVYDYNGNSFVYNENLNSPDTEVLFGSRLSTSDDLAVISDIWYSNTAFQQGRIYTFANNQGNWSYDQTLTQNIAYPNANVNFGSLLDMSRITNNYISSYTGAANFNDRVLTNFVST